MDRKYFGFFSENELTMANNGNINNFLTNKVNYDKAKIIDYLSKGKKEASCPKEIFDVITQKKLSSSFSVYTDGEYVWKSDLEYYIKNYNLILPDDFISKAQAEL